jgi:hypothetical protein
MTWITKGRNEGSLACDSCGALFEYPEFPRAAVLQLARAHGWHAFKGQSLTGKDLDSHLCETCVGSNRSRQPKPAHLDGEVPLWTEEEVPSWKTVT